MLTRAGFLIREYHFQEISGGHEILEMGKRKMNARAYVAIQFPRNRSGEEGRRAFGW